MEESAVVRRALGLIAILAGALVLASCGSDRVSAVKACLQRAGFSVYLTEVSEPALPRRGGGEVPAHAGLEGGLTLNQTYEVYVWDSQSRARSYAEAQHGMGYDVIGTAAAGPFSFSSQPGVPVPPTDKADRRKIEADRRKIESCLNRA